MSKELLLVRHADARAAESGQRDAERELSPRGYQDATRLGHYLYQQQQNVDFLLISTAQRAQRTAEIIAEQMHYGPHKIQLLDKLYQASVRSMLEVINGQADEFDCLMVVGHNPTLTYLAEYLTGEAVNSMEAGGLLVLGLTANSWAEVTQQSAVVKAYVTPDQLRQR